MKAQIFLIYLFGVYVAFNTVQVISQRVVRRAEETSTYSLLGFCTVNCRPTARNYQLSHLRPCRESNPGLRGGRRVLPLCHRGPPDIFETLGVWAHENKCVGEIYGSHPLACLKRSLNDFHGFHFECGNMQICIYHTEIYYWTPFVFWFWNQKQTTVESASSCFEPEPQPFFEPFVELPPTKLFLLLELNNCF